MLNIELKLFSLDKALSGASIAFGENNTVTEYIYNFRDTHGVIEASRYRGESDSGKSYFFDKDGLCSDNVPSHTLFIVEATEEGTLDENAGTKCDDEIGVCNDINITALNPRETIAVKAMQSIISTLENPISMDGALIDRVSTLSFEIAQSMLATAVKYRETPSASVIVEEENVSSMTDKLLYNINNTLNILLNDIDNTLEGIEANTKKEETV